MSEQAKVILVVFGFLAVLGLAIDYQNNNPSSGGGYRDGAHWMP